jgi:septum formation protein
MSAMATRRLILASASPRRRELLAQIGIAPEILACDVAEVRAPAETPLAYSRRVALAKAAAGWQRSGMDPASLVLGADTEVVVDDVVFGKPADDSAALRMLRDLSGREHLVLSSVAVVGAAFEAVETCTTRVRFARMSERAIREYVGSGEPAGRAGGYAIQGLAAAFVASIEGSYSGVMGLPLFETVSLLRRAGLAVISE